MPIQFYNLAWNLYHAEHAQTMQNLFQNAQQATSYTAATDSINRGKQDVAEQVRPSNSVENREIQAESRGAHSHTLTGEEKKEEQEKEKPIPDPYGRGKSLDIKS